MISCTARFAVKVRTMADHKFKIGQSVYLPLKMSRSREPPGKAYLVIQQLPAPTGKIRYRLRSADDERVVSELELRPASKFAGRRREHGFS